MLTVMPLFRHLSLVETVAPSVIICLKHFDIIYVSHLRTVRGRYVEMGIVIAVVGTLESVGGGLLVIYWIRVVLVSHIFSAN
jgi:hypothetical protein